MRQQGRVVDWHDARGYGFVVTHATEQRIFLHIKQFTGSRLRRPKIGDILTYEMVPGERGKPTAISVAFAIAAKSRPPTHTQHTRGGAAELLVMLFGLLLAWMVWTRGLPGWIAVVYLLLSLVTYAVYAHDKQAATNGRWRTAESTLQLLALLGGWPGAWLAQKWLRHKSGKADFQRTFWIIVTLNLAGLIGLSRRMVVG